MPAIALNAGFDSFGALLQQTDNRFEIDLSGRTLIEVLQEAERYNKLKGRHSSLSCLIYNIRQVEFSFNSVVMPFHVTDVFYAYFVQFLLTRGCLPSTINTYCAQLKGSLTWATKHNCRVSSTYDEFQSSRFERTRVALTPDQVSHIYHFDLDTIKCRSDKKNTLRRVRDMFILSCNLGQRYSDMIRITPSCFDEGKSVFKIVQQKTGNTARVDLNNMTIDKSVTREILERYNWRSPYTGDISNYDHYLHELLEIIGCQFSEKSVVSENKINGEVVKDVAPLYKKVSSHTGRRTFISYHVIRGVHEAQVRRCSGHTDSRSFAKYIVFDD